MKNYIYTLLILLILPLNLFGQQEKQSIAQREQIYVHYNTTLTYSGEYVYYKIYTIDRGTKRLSNHSRVVFLALVDPSKKEIIKQKVRLIEGQGQGDFFIPENIPSGNYKLVSYTQEMKQAGIDYFFQADLSVVNPYESPNPNFIAMEKEAIKVDISEEKRMTGTTHILKMKTPQNSYKRRQKATLDINLVHKDAIDGDYSLSIKKVDFKDTPKQVNATSYEAVMPKRPNYIKTNGYRKSLNGDLIKGKVSNKNGLTNDVYLGVTILDNEFNIKVEKATKDGSFQFNLNDDYDGQNVGLQVLGDLDGNYAFEIENAKSIDYGKLEFSDFRLSVKIDDVILQKSIHNQLENAFFSAKPDTVKIPPVAPPFYGAGRGATFLLDDYTRFNTMEESVTEIIEDCWVEKRKGRKYFVVRPENIAWSEKIKPILIVDGIWVQDHEKLLALDSKQVNSITVVRDNYVLGGKEYQGVMEVKTKEGAFINNVPTIKVKQVSLHTTQESKRYYQPNYTTNYEQLKRVPDYRTQLLWLPKVSVIKEGTTVEFYTSDNSGLYEISLEGFTKKGEPVSLRGTVLVE